MWPNRLPVWPPGTPQILGSTIFTLLTEPGSDMCSPVGREYVEVFVVPGEGAGVASRCGTSSSELGAFGYTSM